MESVGWLIAALALREDIFRKMMRAENTVFNALGLSLMILANLDIITKLEIMPMNVTKVSASEFQQAFGALSDRARHEPVVITKHGRDSLVVMSAEETLVTFIGIISNLVIISKFAKIIKDNPRALKDRVFCPRHLAKNILAEREGGNEPSHRFHDDPKADRSGEGRGLSIAKAKASRFPLRSFQAARRADRR